MQNLIVKLEDFTKFLFSKKFILIEEKIFGALAGILFVFNLSLILLNRYEIIEISQFDNVSVISAISLPFTVILLSEIFLLVKSYNRPLIFSLIVQIQIISLIFARDIFKVFSELEGLGDSGIFNEVVEITILLSLAFLLFFISSVVDKFCEAKKNKNLMILNEVRPISKLRQILTLLIFVSTLGFLVAYIYQNIYPGPLDYIAAGAELDSFFENVFTIMILSDVFLFLTSFIYHEEYPQLFTNAVFILSAILLRLSITAEFPTNIYLVIISIVVILLTLFLNTKNSIRLVSNQT